MFHSLLVVTLVTLTVSMSGAASQDPGGDKPTAPAVLVPTFANPTCPIMGKKVSMPLFVDTELGRFYVCCKPCNKKILADVPAAHKTAYPTVQAVKNPVCPVSGAAIGDDAVEITLQGYSFKLCCAKCGDEARREAQVVLTKITRDTITDVDNQTCPITGKPVIANTIVLIGDSLVHLSSPQLVDEVSKDPAAVLAKAKALAKQQPARPKHEHGKAPVAPAAEASAKGTAK